MQPFSAEARRHHGIGVVAPGIGDAQAQIIAAVALAQASELGADIATHATHATCAACTTGLQAGQHMAQDAARLLPVQQQGAAACGVARRCGLDKIGRAHV